MKTFDKTVAQEFQHILLFVDEIFSMLEEKGLKPKGMNLNNGEGEYGFYLRSKDGKSDIFVGLWLDCWIQKGSPFCIALYSKSRFASEYKQRFIESIKNQEKIFDTPFTFDDYLTSTINSNALFITENEEKVAQFLFDLFYLLDFQNIDPNTIVESCMLYIPSPPATLGLSGGRRVYTNMSPLTI